MMDKFHSNQPYLNQRWSLLLCLPLNEPHACCLCVNVQSYATEAAVGKAKAVRVRAFLNATVGLEYSHKKSIVLCCQWL